MRKVLRQSEFKGLNSEITGACTPEKIRRSPLAARLIGVVCRHHNKIQFFGYELANMLLLWHRSGNGEPHLGGLTYEALAAIAFLFGSACIYAYDPESRPTGLFYGGVGLVLGGVFLFLAGYPLTGLSVALASLETVRGGLFALQTDLTRSQQKASEFANHTLTIGRNVFSFYIIPVEWLCRRFGRLGRFLNDRPFLTSALIKLPLRLEFVIKNMLQGDVIGSAVGLSWMLLGDGALAFNDQELRRTALRYSRVDEARSPLAPLRTAP